MTRTHDGDRDPATPSPGKVRAARLTDLAALGELSRLCQSDDPTTRSLGLPVSGPPIGVFSLFRLPLGAFRPNDLMYVYEEDGRIAGLIRVERESTRDEWTIVELDAVGMADAGDIRYRLVNQLLREGAKRGAARFHVACADADGNVELMMQAGFIRYGEEQIMFRDRRPRAAGAVGRQGGPCRADPAGAGARRARRCTGCTRPRRRVRSRVSSRSASPIGSARAIIPACRARASHRSCASPRSSPTSRRRRTVARTGPSSMASSRSVSPRKISRTISRCLSGRRPISSALIAFGLGIIEARTSKGGEHRHDHGVIAPVRTYEAPIDARLEDAAFGSVANVTLLMKETLVRVAEPALVPAGVR